ncbi:pyridoxamine 5'-phosphate oxidase-like FMN-binding protein [Natrialba chahannaoensis JCM 10990]|uniref:Pyridoxamine 5'-phosphate oxidase-like FMN-binding protein n=1 Tax=Natrialba chahannaoensis JCM 10990 TaxID=1227492 RepID=M0B1G2_9EURY|nr:pyridoxamine 5'-phosphate oxidase family protein [Natrialba chahannaoensis]ELZ04756.1 pyridoxamine 5'-phosphate oxidase-like FMN-binding protein [Natrialba chahannaoensis JCM 10990]
MVDSPSVASDDIRYQGKAVAHEDWIREFLAGQETGVLGLTDSEEPHLVTQLFVCEDDSIYVHGASDGRAYDLVSSTDEPQACFTTSEMGRFIPAAEPVNFTVEYASVVAYGPISLLTERADKRDVLESFMDKFAPQLTPGEDYEPMSDESIDRTAVYQLAVDRWSAKRGEKPADEPGAYDSPLR